MASLDFKARAKWPSGTIVTIQNADGEFLTKVPGTHDLVCSEEFCEVEHGSEWTLLQQDDEKYQISHSYSSTCLDVCEESKKDGAPVMLYVTTGQKNQLWEFSKARGGHYYIRAVHSYKGLDMIDGKRDRIGQWDLWGGRNQLWKIKLLETATSSDSD